MQLDVDIDRNITPKNNVHEQTKESIKIAHTLFQCIDYVIHNAPKHKLPVYNFILTQRLLIWLNSLHFIVCDV